MFPVTFIFCKVIVDSWLKWLKLYPDIASSSCLWPHVSVKLKLTSILMLPAIYDLMSRSGTLNLRGSLRRLFSLTSSETSTTLVKSDTPPSPNNRVLIVGLGNYPAPRSRHSVGEYLPTFIFIPFYWYISDFSRSRFIQRRFNGPWFLLLFGLINFRFVFF